MRIRQVSESAFTVKGHGVHTAFVELTNALKKQPGIQVVVNRPGKVDITHIHTVGLFSLLFLLFGSGKKVVSAHVVPESLRGSLVGADHWLRYATAYLRWFYNRADVVFAVSDATKRELEAIGVKSLIKVVYNIIDTEQYRTTEQDRLQARKRLNIPDDAWVVMAAGQVQPRKRIDSFVAAATQCHRMEFIWVGGMPFGKLAAENTTMQHLINDAPANVTVTGVVEHAKVRGYYQAADVFWLPSIQETFGLVVVEAAAAGLPVVLRDIPDYSETFAGLAVMSHEDDFVDTLRQLRDDPDYYARQKENAAKIVEKFGLRRGVERVMGVYQSLLPKLRDEI